VAGINRNARPEWIGIGGRNRPESVAGMRRNTHQREDICENKLFFTYFDVFPSLFFPL
jgi:hypothetical protein